jgi:hypothetical protein
MSSRSRRDPQELVIADREVGRTLAADADRVLHDGDWRRELLGDTPDHAVVVDMPRAFAYRVEFAPTLARAIAAEARSRGVNPARFIHDVMLTEMTRRTGQTEGELRESASTTYLNSARLRQ